MVEFIELLFLTSLAIWGVHGCFQLMDLSEAFRWLPIWLQKPLFDCPPCMSSIYGTSWFWLLYHNPSIPYWIIFVFCLCGLNYIIKEHLYES